MGGGQESRAQERTKILKVTVCAYALCLASQFSIAQVTGSVLGRDRGSPEVVTAVPPHANYVRMTQADRLHDYFKSAFGVEGVLRSLAGAGISQWENTPSEWGQGAEGYAKRFANSYGQHFIRSTMMYGASSVLHEDNRYLPSEESGFGPRLKYAIASSFLARRDDGSRYVSISRLSSYLATAFISREWQPRSTSGAPSAVSSFGTAMGATVCFNVAREFLPEFFQRHRN